MMMKFTTYIYEVHQKKKVCICMTIQVEMIEPHMKSFELPIRNA